MIRIKWELEEAVALFAFYFANEKYTKDDLAKLSAAYNKRAKLLGLKTDVKFRNLNGLSLQLGCITYVVSNGKHGCSATSKLFYDTYKLYQTLPEVFNTILQEFNRKYM